MKEPEFANILSGIFDKAKPVIRINSVGKSKIKRAINTVYATFSLADTQYSIHKMLATISELVIPE
jgi:hypothetical protein